MSENLKRAESLFNRIMSQNGNKETQFKSSVKHKDSRDREFKDNNHNNHSNNNQNNNPHSHNNHSNNGKHNTSNGSGVNNVNGANNEGGGNGNHHGHNHRHHHNKHNEHGHGYGHGHGHGRHDHGHGHHNNNHGYNRYKHKNEILNHEALKVPEKVLNDIDGQVLLTKHDQHILPYCWTIWHHFRYHNNNNHSANSLNSDGNISSAVLSKKKQEDKLNYLQMTREVEFPKFSKPQELIKNFGSVEQLWTNLSLMGKSKDVPIGTEYFIFKSGINPAWEDPFNTKGGRWIFKFIRRNGNEDEQKIRIRTNLIWERLILRILTGSLISKQEYNEEVIELILGDINGIVLSIRKEEDIISLWNSNLNKSKKHSNIPIRRILCDSILRVIKECDLILQGQSIYTTSESLHERIKGVSFEYRLHSDHTAAFDKFRKFNKKDDNESNENVTQ